VKVARTFHSRRVLRNDVLHRSLYRRTDYFFGINAGFALPGRTLIFTPPPIDHRQFNPEGPAIPKQTKLVTVIGKLSRDRGFEDALRTFAALRRARTDVKLMIIGHGEHRPILEELSSSLGIADDVIWAGYHEDDLAEHYRASDVLLFTARGSDEGHRAVLEAMACGVPPATYPIEGIEALVGPAHVAPSASPEALAVVAESLLDRDLRAPMYEHSLEFGYEQAARRLLTVYG
jgi:glycosyltransferase involved in cell wall biosynthesis